MTMSGNYPRARFGIQSITMSSVTATAAAIAKKNGIGRAVKTNTNQSTDTSTTTTEMKKTKRVYRKRKHLHHDLIMEQILSKVPVKHLLRCGAVSKPWYNSIHNDKRLTYTHSLQSQKKPDLVFNLLNVKDRVTDTGRVKFGSRFFKLESCLISNLQRLRANAVRFPTMELVGYCNGFPCIAIASSTRRNYKATYGILQIYRGETMYITCTPIADQYIKGNNPHIICHGFGFDSLANEYKVVSLYRTSHKELNFVVFTLGTNSWRDVSTSAPVSVHGLPVTRIRAATGKDRQAIFCSNAGSGPGGCLVWKVIITVAGEDNNEMEMLLLFNLHDENFQFIRLQTKGTTGEEQKQSLVDYPHLLEFKGYPCIARVEKLLGNNGSDCYYPLRHDLHGSGSCCCCCKVHLYVFKDNVKQVWVKEESFDVCVKPSNLRYYPSWCVYLHDVPYPCCFCFGSTTTPPTRIFSFSDQIFLYWFDGRYLQVFDLRSKRLRLASPSSGSDAAFFRAKMKEPSSSHTFDEGDDNIYCSRMDYQLHCQGENFLSLQSFVPEGVQIDGIQLLRN